MKKLLPLKSIFSLTFAILIAASINGQYNNHAWLDVIDPQNPWWYKASGVIKEAVVTIEPQGLYVEYNFYMSFGAKSMETDSNEIRYEFYLPPNSIVHDSWLWVGDSAVPGYILDKWTAYGIYEGIVNRRKDPSILSRSYKNRYQLNIYPLRKDSVRKVKMSVLVPAEWNNNSITVPMPLGMFKTGYEYPELQVVIKKDDVWGQVSLSGDGDFLLKQIDHQIIGTAYECKVDVNTTSSLNIEFGSPYKNGMWFSKYPLNSEEGYYQLSVLPDYFASKTVKKNVVFVVDYNKNTTNLDKSAVLDAISASIKNNIQHIDSFNVVLSNFFPQLLSSGWIAGDDPNLEATLQALVPANLASYSNLNATMGKAAEFLHHYTYTDPPLVIVLSSSDEQGKSDIANDLFEDLVNLMDTMPVIHAGNIANTNVHYYYQGGNSFFGNEYYFNLLARNTGGNYMEFRNSGHTISSFINTLISSAFYTLHAHDLYVSMDNGFCFGKYNSTNINGHHFTPAISEIGKYKGSGSFNITFSGIINDESFSEKIEIAEQDIYVADTLLEECWVGNFIASMESGEYLSNSAIGEIIDNSIKHRVLSNYTAFLVLEPGMELPDEDDEDTDDSPNWITPVEENQVAPVIALTAYPNPFRNQILINIEGIQSTELQKVVVYNLLGEVIKTFDVSDFKGLNQVELNWNGHADNGEMLSAGVYYLVVMTKEFKKTMKIVKE